MFWNKSSCVLCDLEPLNLKFWRFLSRHCLYSKSHINGRYLCSIEAFNMIDHLQVYNTIYWAQNQGKISPSTSNLDDGFGQIPVVYNFLVRIWHSHDRYTYKLFGVEKTWNISKRWRFLLETANLEHLRNHEDSEMVKVSWRQGMSTWRHSMFSLPENTRTWLVAFGFQNQNPDSSSVWWISTCGWKVTKSTLRVS